MKPYLKYYSGEQNPKGKRVSLSLDGGNHYVLSLTEKGVYLWSTYYGIDLGANNKPKVFRGSCQNFPEFKVASKACKDGITIYCESDGKTAILVAYDEVGNRNYLLKVTPEGIYRYPWISKSLLDALGFPYDSKHRLPILR